jgi:hypothetical protein
VTEDGDGPLWTYEPISGAGTFNVTSRAVGCATARRVVRRTKYVRSGPRGPAGWRCGYVREAYEFVDIRCTATGGRVVRWQSGA